MTDSVVRWEARYLQSAAVVRTGRVYVYRAEV
jgi:hypothetical protein